MRRLIDLAQGDGKRSRKVAISKVRYRELEAPLQEPPAPESIAKLTRNRFSLLHQKHDSPRFDFSYSCSAEVVFEPAEFETNEQRLDRGKNATKLHCHQYRSPPFNENHITVSEIKG
jgi:hypothetical protein